MQCSSRPRQPAVQQHACAAHTCTAPLLHASCAALRSAGSMSAWYGTADTPAAVRSDAMPSQSFLQAPRAGMSCSAAAAAGNAPHKQLCGAQAAASSQRATPGQAVHDAACAARLLLHPGHDLCARSLCAGSLVQHLVAQARSVDAGRELLGLDLQDAADVSRHLQPTATAAHARVALHAHAWARRGAGCLRGSPCAWEQQASCHAAGVSGSSGAPAASPWL